jgi:Na+-driven multidrug efflux pump
MQLDTFGAALATDLTYFINLIIFSVIMAVDKDIKPACFCLNRQNFNGIKEQFNNSMGWIILIAFDMWNFEMLTLESGVLSVLDNAT